MSEEDKKITPVKWREKLYLTQRRKDAPVK